MGDEQRKDISVLVVEVASELVVRIDDGVQRVAVDGRPGDAGLAQVAEGLIDRAKGLSQASVLVLKA